MLSNSRQYLPRKGTETWIVAGLESYQSGNNSRQYLPRKGTETPKTVGNMAKDIVTFPTIFTPQGDGNNFLILKGAINFKIPDNIYPARGRIRGGLLVA